MKIAVAGCGRWGSLIAWYLDRTGHRVTLYGRESSPHMKRFLAERRNDLLSLPERITLDTSLSCLCDAEVIVISIASQGLRSFMRELAPLGLHNKIFVLCMKGIEVGSLCRLSEVAPDRRLAGSGSRAGILRRDPQLHGNRRKSPRGHENARRCVFR